MKYEVIIKSEDCMGDFQLLTFEIKEQGNAFSNPTA